MPGSGIDALIVHSPLVGPTTTGALADALAARGWTTTAPDLRASSSSPQAFVAAASRAADGVEVLVGHSGAGALLPAIAHHTNATVTVYIDAVVPEARQIGAPSGGFLSLLEQLPVVDGLLPRWHEWWSTEILVRLLPDEHLRRAVVEELPRLPRSFYDDAVRLPDLWWRRPAAFLQLSPAYHDDRARAERWGWPTHRLDGQHLDLLTRADVVADIVTHLVIAARPPTA